MSTSKAKRKQAKTKTKENKNKNELNEFIQLMENWNKDKRFRNWIEKKFRETIVHFIFDFYRIKVEFAKQSEFSKDGEVMFKVNASKKYHRILIYVYPLAYRLYRENKRGDIMEGIVHELAHAHTAELTKLAHERFIRQEEIENECENLTEIVAEYVRRGIKVT